MKYNEKQIKIKPAFIECRLNEIPTGISWSKEKENKTKKILSTPKSQMLYTTRSKNKFSQRSFVALLEDRLEAETFSGEIYQDRQMVVDGDYMVPGKVASKWNKSAEELRKWLYNMAIKFHNTKNRRNGPSMDTHKVIIKAQKKG